MCTKSDITSSTDPLVSVIVISRDRPEFLKRALQSIHAQDWRPIEIVLIDNQSSSPVLPLESNSDRLETKVYATPRLLNGSEARNFAAQRASGEYIAYLDDDDFLLPQSLSLRASALIDNPSVDIAYMNTSVIGPHGREIELLSGTPDWPIMVHVHLNALMVRRRVIFEEPFEERITKDIDDQLAIRIFRRYPWIHIDQVGAVWNNDGRPDQVTHWGLSPLGKLQNRRQKYLNSKIMCEDVALLIDQDKKLKRYYYGRQSKWSLATFRPFEALHFALAAIDLCPGPKPSGLLERTKGLAAPHADLGQEKTTL